MKSPTWRPYGTEVMEYLPEGDDYIPVAEWGKDHWGTFAYLETCAVDNKGVIHNVRMRCNARLHRRFANLGFAGAVLDGSKYPTVLNRGVVREKHDDWSCLEDMIAAGLVQSWWYDRGVKTFGGAVARVEFTPLGWELAGQLREHKGRDGVYATFVPVMPDVGIVVVPTREVVVD